MVLECDARLISRAVSNLAQNRINHNPQGCGILLSLADFSEEVSLTVADNGAGLSAEKLRELEEKPHYLESTTSGWTCSTGWGCCWCGRSWRPMGGP